MTSQQGSYPNMFVNVNSDGVKKIPDISAQSPLGNGQRFKGNAQPSLKNSDTFHNNQGQLLSRSMNQSTPQRLKQAELNNSMLNQTSPQNKSLIGMSNQTTQQNSHNQEGKRQKSHNSIYEAPPFQSQGYLNHQENQLSQFSPSPLKPKNDSLVKESQQSYSGNEERNRRNSQFNLVAQQKQFQDSQPYVPSRSKSRDNIVQNLSTFSRIFNYPVEGIQNQNRENRSLTPSQFQYQGKTTSSEIGRFINKPQINSQSLDLSQGLIQNTIKQRQDKMRQQPESPSQTFQKPILHKWNNPTNNSQVFTNTFGTPQKELKSDYQPQNSNSENKNQRNQDIQNFYFQQQQQQSQQWPSNTKENGLTLKVERCTTPTRSQKGEQQVSPIRIQKGDQCVTPTRSQKGECVTPTRSQKSEQCVTPNRSQKGEKSVTPNRSQKGEQCVTPNRSQSNRPQQFDEVSAKGSHKSTSSWISEMVCLNCENKEIFDDKLMKQQEKKKQEDENIQRYLKQQEFELNEYIKNETAKKYERQNQYAQRAQEQQREKFEQRQNEKQAQKLREEQMMQRQTEENARIFKEKMEEIKQRKQQINQGIQRQILEKSAQKEREKSAEKQYGEIYKIQEAEKMKYMQEQLEYKKLQTLKFQEQLNQQLEEKRNRPNSKAEITQFYQEQFAVQQLMEKQVQQQIAEDKAEQLKNCKQSWNELVNNKQQKKTYEQMLDQRMKQVWVEQDKINKQAIAENVEKEQKKKQEVVSSIKQHLLEKQEQIKAERDRKQKEGELIKLEKQNAIAAAREQLRCCDRCNQNYNVSQLTKHSNKHKKK